MRLSTRAERDRAHGSAVIHAALDAGARLLDTADAYGHDDRDMGHNERLVAAALRSWSGDAGSVRVATKGGLRRPGGRWRPDGRAVHLRAACAASREALGVDVIDLYQLHAVDPRTPLETSVRALATLRDAGQVRRIGLCNVTVAQIETARRITTIDAVQVSIGVFDDTNLRNGVAEYCRDHGIDCIAYRPLGGERSARIAKDPVLRSIAESRGVSPYEVALAWLCDLDARLTPIPGPTRLETARSLANVASVRFTDDDRARLDERFPAGRLLRVPRRLRRAPDDADGEVVLVMGMPAAGKTTLARELVTQGYERLNRDDRGGRLSDLVRALDQGLGAGGRRFVLDNTYPTRHARNEVIECAWRHGVPARCIWVATTLADAQINAVERLLDAHGSLPDPATLAARGRTDHRYFGPDAQFRYQRQLEPPVPEEGFVTVESRPVERRSAARGTRGLFIEFDGVLCASASGADRVTSPEDVRVPADVAARLAGMAAKGWRAFGIAWRPDGGAGAEAVFTKVREALGVDIDIAACVHPPGPPVCWCRKPLPGLVLAFARQFGVSLPESLLVGDSAADRTLAERLRMRCLEPRDWLASDPEG